MNPPDTAHHFDNFERLNKMIQRYAVPPVLTIWKFLGFKIYRCLDFQCYLTLGQNLLFCLHIILV